MEWSTNAMCGRFSRSKAVFRVHSELRIASDEFSGHCLDLTLLGSYLSDAYNGDIHCRKEVSKRLAQDVRQGRARLLSGEDPRQREHLDTHPLVREYFGKQLRSNQTGTYLILYVYGRRIPKEKPTQSRKRNDT
jgi:hypothetical protein